MLMKVFDKNSDGWIDENELQQTMKELGVTLSTKDVNAMFSQVGCKETRRITYAGEQQKKYSTLLFFFLFPFLFLPVFDLT